MNRGTRNNLGLALVGNDTYYGLNRAGIVICKPWGLIFSDVVDGRHKSLRMVGAFLKRLVLRIKWWFRIHHKNKKSWTILDSGNKGTRAELWRLAFEAGGCP